MRKTAALAMVTLCLLSLVGCEGLTAAPTATVPAASPVATAAPTPAPTPEPTPPGVLEEGVYARFEAVGFGAESAGTPAVAKWDGPIRIEVLGKPGVEDGKTLYRLAEAFRAVPGVPEITFVTAGGNVRVAFVPMAEAGGVDGRFSGSEHAQMLVDGDGPARGSLTLLLSDELADRAARDGSLSSMFLRALGLRRDDGGGEAGSALNGASPAAFPSPGDLLMLALLYDPAVKAGMGAEEAMAVVRTLDPGNAPGVPSANAPVSKREALEYFNEVGFYWGNSGDGIVRKWNEPIRLQIVGEPTMDQRDLLDGYLARLVSLAGFPGITAVDGDGDIVITYGTLAELRLEYPELGETDSCFLRGGRGGKSGGITSLRLYAATDFADAEAGRTQFLRLLMWSLGFSFTSDRYPDSVFNPASDALDWASLDWQMVALLYRPDLEPGDKRAAVMARLLGEGE